MNFLEELNPEQLAAVQSAATTTCVVAGPGTGKTKTLIARILYLLNDRQILPSQIVALTFTKKAAAEMRERLLHAIGNSIASQVWIGTFHALCHQILHQSGISIHLIPEERRIEYLKEAIELSKWHGSVQDASALITRAKNSLMSDHIPVLEAYQDILRRENRGDYDDILVRSYCLIRDNAELRSKLQQKIRHILIDEFQDTSPVQYETIKMLRINAPAGGSLYAIGDPHQSIYAFRGSSADIFSLLQSDFPDCKEVVLSLNYRSHKNIITVSSRLFPQIQLTATRQEPGSVELVQTLNEYAEADLVVSRISTQVGGTDLLQASIVDNLSAGCRFSDCAVIYRSHRLRYPLTKALLRSGIPFQAIGEESPFHKSYIRFIIDCLRFIYTKDHQSRSKLQQYSFIKPLDIDKYLIAIDPKGAKVIDLIHNIEQPFSLSEVYKDDKEYVINLKQFTQSFLHLSLQENCLKHVLSHIDFLMENEFYDSRADRVTLLTMHAAKGLEFAHVFVSGFEDGIIPHTKHNSIEEVEEEKRLLYVALTRAKESLTILHTRSRDNKVAKMSRFHERLVCPELKEKQDENTVRILKRIEKNAIQKSQMKLF